MGFLLLVWAAQAQEGYHYGLIRGGLQQPESYSLTIGLDFVTRYHNSLELAVSWENPKNGNDEMYLSAAYKQALTRGKNNALKLRLGAQGGSDNHDFMGGPLGGLEWQYSLGGNLDLLLVNQYSYCFGSGRGWRIGLELGFRFTF